MSMTDPISDMLTRIRNGQKAKKVSVSMPASRMKLSIARVLEDEGYLMDVSATDEAEPKRTMTLALKYHQGVPVIEQIDRASRPGLRLYAGSTDIPKVQEGLGVAIVSTSHGVMTDRQARSQGHGGEILCFVS
jgi:small subunit ribosomal protein S8